MTRSVHIKTYKEVLEQPTLFDALAQSKHDFIRYSLQFDFREVDTLVYQKSLILSTHPRDWHFKARLIETIRKEITQCEAFVFTNWSKWGHFKYSYDLQDNARMLHWLNQKSLLTLFDIR
jgi:hypothetical protein